MLQTHSKSGDNDLIGSIPEEIRTLTFLQSINFDTNQVSGPIPTSIGELTDLRNIDMDSNMLSGAIPTQIFSLQQLQVLDLDTNLLTGSIPTEVGNAISLQSLQVQSNDLTGVVPTEMGNLRSLSVLLIQQNSITGSMPAEVCALAQDPLAGLVGTLGTIQADCASPPTPPEITCPENCCTLCFSDEGNVDGRLVGGSLSSSIGDIQIYQALSLRSGAPLPRQWQIVQP